MNRSPQTALLLVAALLLPVVASSQDAETPAITEDLLSGLKLRGIGPASRSGRIADVAIDPNDTSTWYMAVASGNAFKTTNRGTTWEPIFENYPVYSTSTVVVDPSQLERRLAGNRREQRPAVGALRERRLAEPRRRGFVRTYGTRRVGTHRQDRP